MGSYGRVAVRAAELLRQGALDQPRLAWDAAAREVFPESRSSQAKSCPRGAFLGLCEEGLVRGLPAGKYANSKANKTYALRAVALLHEEPALSTASANALWARVMNGEEKRPNGQMDVVLALWEQKLLGKLRGR